MSAFTFDFDLEDDLDESFDAIPHQQSAAASPTDKTLTLQGEPGSEIPAEEIPLSSLLSTLPEALSYSPLALPGTPSACGRTLARRDLFDARFQLLLAQGGSDSERDEKTAAFVDAPADLVPGAYEGGLKTWECALDLAAYLDREDVLFRVGARNSGRRVVRGLRVLELGCGTAVPTLLLLDCLFSHLASEPASPSGGDVDNDDVGSTPALAVQETDIHLQDYNRSVLELVTFPNILLTWYMSSLSAEYRSSMTDSDPDSDNDDDDEEEGAPGGVTAQGRPSRPGAGAHRRGPGHLTMTPALLSAFTASLDAHKVRLRFFAGGWASLRELLLLSPQAQELGMSSPTPPPPQPPLPYDVVLASETIYRTETLGAFLNVLRTAGGGASPAPVTDTPVAAGVVPSPLCLVAAKVLYFGVGGGVQAFVRAVEGENGTVRTVWEHREGVGRMIMRVEW